MLAPVTMHKAIKYAFYEKAMPDKQRTFFMQNFGCSRKVYNLYVDFLYDKLDKAGYTGGTKLPKIHLPEVTALKKQYPYLKDADALGLANAKQNFEKAVQRYNKESDFKSYTKRALRRDQSGTEPLTFRGLKGMPKFKSKAHGDFSYTTNCQYPAEGKGLKQPTIRLEGDTLYIPKLKEGIKLVIHQQLPEDAVIGSATISMDIDGRMYVSIEYTYVVQMDLSLREAALKDDPSILDGLKILGLDYSQQDFYVDSEGRTANYPHYYRKSEEKLARLQRQLSHMEKGSKNYQDKQAEIAKVHIKIRNQRKDFINKLASKLASEYDVIVVEDIDLRAMGGALSLGQNLHDNGFGMFREQLAKKLEAKGSLLVKIDRWFPSTKRCHHCGCVNPDVKLGMSKWVCPHCGVELARDWNAAINIREEGKRILLEAMRTWLEEDAKSRAKAEAMTKARKEKGKSKDKAVVKAA